MLICHCKGKTHRDVLAAVADGARDLADLKRVSGVGGACGGCHEALGSMLHSRHRDPCTEVKLRADR